MARFLNWLAPIKYFGTGDTKQLKMERSHQFNCRQGLQTPSKALLLWQDAGVTRVPQSRFLKMPCKVAAVRKVVRAWYQNPNEVHDAEVLLFHCST